MMFLMLRAVALDLLIRVRTVGAWPWIVYLCIGLLSRGQEPTILRSDSIFLCHQSLWVATWFLLALHLLSVGGTRGNRPGLSLLLALVLTSLLGAVQCLVTFILDLALPGPVEPSLAIDAGMRFLLPGIPVALLCMKRIQQQSMSELIIRSTAFLVMIGLALASWRLPTHQILTASFVLAMAAMMLTCASQPTSSSAANPDPS